MLGGFASTNNTSAERRRGAANVIAFNDIIGVVGNSQAGTGNAIRGNSIYDNGELGIDSRHRRSARRTTGRRR